MTESIPTPDLIFVDLNMPRTNGHEFLLKVKAISLLKNVPVIIYSTSSERKDIEESLRLGAAYYLVKQSAVSEIRKELDVILGFNLPLKPTGVRRCLFEINTVIRNALTCHTSCSPRRHMETQACQVMFFSPVRTGKLGQL